MLWHFVKSLFLFFRQLLSAIGAQFFSYIIRWFVLSPLESLLLQSDLLQTHVQLQWFSTHHAFSCHLSSSKSMGFLCHTTPGSTVSIAFYSLLIIFLDCLCFHFRVNYCKNFFFCFGLKSTSSYCLCVLSILDYSCTYLNIAVSPHCKSFISASQVPSVIVF